ncbi:SGNH/GDSL hydrolase family protein [Nocardioides alcanivorans]|uniref:SGNH/GDSL hydrolase family protein n=1 Tax=Nocardioides alcanivorans TaxID=2897352 RepID=UPI001F3F3847|nr:SGNH/GDSL hydrolase family protein [Nocardioides alcanivorans]
MNVPIITRDLAPLIHGAAELETTAHGIKPHRLPAWARAQCDDGQLAMAEAKPSGVRLRFRTSATCVELVALPTKFAYVGVPPGPEGLYDLLVDGELFAQGAADSGHTLLIDMARGGMEHQPGEPGSVTFTGLPAKEKEVEIWLSFREVTEVIELRTDAPVLPATPSTRRSWLHHGSSISHGSDAASPSRTWPAIAATLGQVDLTNLGLGGSALLDPFVARTIRDTPTDLISVKIGINLVNLDLMRRRAFGPALHGFLDTIRDGHPDVPLLVVSPLFSAIHEDTPGPAMPVFDDGPTRFRAAGDPRGVAAGQLTLTVIREAMSGIVEQRRSTDHHLHLLDGLALYGSHDSESHPLPDNLHPDAATHELIGTRFAEQVFSDGGAFSDQAV